MTAPGTGYAVVVAALKGYKDNLKSYQDQAHTITGKVAESDVANESWGVVGLMTKNEYTTSLHTLNDLMTQLHDGLGNLAAKVEDVANTYAGVEDDHIVMFGEHLAQLDGPR